MVVGFKDVDELLAKIERGEFNETEVKSRKRDRELEKRYKAFCQNRINDNHQGRIANWTYEKFRYLIDLLHGHSQLTSRSLENLDEQGDFDRVINTDPYDLDTVLYIEHDVNYAKGRSVFLDSRAFESSGETSKRRWALKYLREELCN